MSPEARRRNVERAVAQAEALYEDHAAGAEEMVRDLGATDEEVAAMRAWMDEQARGEIAKLARDLDDWLGNDGKGPDAISLEIH